MQCNTCSGTRFVLVERQQMVTKTFYHHPGGGMCWAHEGGVPVRSTFPTGRYHWINEICDDCNGTGLTVDPARDPDCSWCNGRGEMVVSDGTGCVDFDLCNCEPKRQNIVEAAYLNQEAF